MNDIIKKIKNEYFIYNEDKYRVGTQFIMEYKGKEVTARFINRNSSDSINVILISEDGQKYLMLMSIKDDDLNEKIIEIIPTNYYDEMEANKRYLKDSQVPELVIGWILYISIILILLIFKDRIIGWIFVSVYFFTWRHKKKEDVGTYYDKRS